MTVGKRLIGSILRSIAVVAPILARTLLSVLSWNSRFYVGAARAMNLNGSLSCIVKKGELHGYRFEKLLDEEIYPILHNQMEPICSTLLTRFDLQNKIVLDIGASYGYYAVLLSRLVGADGLVYTFEPDINSLLRLAHNIKINSITNVAILPYAVSHEIKISSWFTDSSQPWNSHLIDPVEFTDSSALSVYPIVTISLDALQDAIPFAHIALVKIDVEGKEADVLRGASKLFAQTRPLALIELHSKEVSDQAFEILRDYDYRWQTIEYQSETRHHIFAFPEETRQEFEILIAKFLAEHSRTVS